MKNAECGGRMKLRKHKASRMDVKIPVSMVECYVKKNSLVIQSKDFLKTLSSAVLNGGLCQAKTIINHQVSKSYRHSRPEEYLKRVVKELRLPTPVVGLMTAANVANFSLQVSKYAEKRYVCAITTAGLSNAAAAGEIVRVNSKFSTINTIILIDGNLTDACMVDLVKTATEAKIIALREFDVRSRISGKQATGTTTDAIVIACTGRGKPLRYGGTATHLGEAVSLTVYRSIKEAIMKEEKLTPERSLISRLKERGITFKSMVEAGMEMLVYHPSMGRREKIAKILAQNLREALSDVNVASLVLAGLRLEEDGQVGLIPGITAKVFQNDPVFLLADELLGMNIANYIAGSCGIFEFVRFDKAKPGILRKLGPFLDDVIGGLIAGASSKMYSQLNKKGS
ncbi:MAG: hypothetical protein DRN49_04595 [Thaumarchaeota archaeon]|nr:MAG: hypothetical protein DRN49_04595 [Nitrososphaerota archaeon]